MVNKDCFCSVLDTYCAQVNGCIGNELILKVGLAAAGAYDVYFEDHFGNLFMVPVTADVSGSLVVDTTLLPAGMLNPVSENMFILITDVDSLEPIPFTIGGEPYDRILVKFRGGTAVINQIGI